MSLPTPFRCMLAANPDERRALPYGQFYATPKVDGVRGFTHSQLGACNRSNKPLPNRVLRELLSHPVLTDLDYEIIHGDPTAPDSFSRSTSAVMTEAGPADGFTIWLFDYFTYPTVPYEQRILSLPDFAYEANRRIGPNLHFAVAAGKRILNPAQLDEIETIWVSRGYEGLVLRGAASTYKFGRSTAREFGMVRWCRSATAEVRILGFEEQMENGNDPTLNERGYTERSSHAEGLWPTGRLGAFICENPLWEPGKDSSLRTFKVGTGEGLDLALRAHIWTHRPEFLGKLLKIRYKPTGLKDRPRQPVSLGFRHPGDLG